MYDAKDTLESGEDHLVRGDGNQDAFVFFRLFDGDTGLAGGRTRHLEYINRNPKCKVTFTLDELIVEATNLGTLMSDLVILEHQFVFCTLSAHGAGDGFTSSHARESSTLSSEALATASSVPPGKSVRFRIVVPVFQDAGLANVYFRGRLTTLWSKPVPKDEWDFATDPRVTEIHLPVSTIIDAQP